MKFHSLKDTIRGWFIGPFEGAFYRTDGAEVAIKRYAKGESGARHYHAISTEFTAVVCGSLLFDGKALHSGDVVEVAVGECADVVALEDNTVTVVVKVPAALNDKYYCVEGR